MEQFLPADLRCIGNGRLSDFVFKPSEGASGGILLAWSNRRWKKLDERVGLFSVSVVLEDMISHWVWTWTGIYGPNAEERRPEFWEDLRTTNEERNRDGGISGAMENFSSWIAEASLLDIPLSNQRFTWCNLWAQPACARLDRVLVDQAWEEAFPLCSLKAQLRICSDHSPLIFEGGDTHTDYHYYKFENWWLLCAGFHEVVMEAWRIPAPGLMGAKKSPTF
ncbi:hypothetical protein QJS10_CPA06g01086 [Acorus calamus]|uniref:Reverse transcriptase n=1 Tax=Acorus calamus TaxID=4465 RepID=A0AAV9EKE4_ACOCL|nr:hypothetical protein QJS10_CPA06g01086 [Acorus calamus]